MSRNSTRHVIITGGSSGIGFEIARHFVAKGNHVSIIARDQKKLDDASKNLRRDAPNAIFSASADVTLPEELEAAIKACEEKFGSCDVLVTSAGTVEPAFFDCLNPAQFHAQMDTNFFGTVNAVRAVYPSMKARRSGSIMMISSAAAFIGIPGYTAYCASKAALASFAESLRSEGSRDVHIGISFPPDTQTPQFESELPKRSELARALMGHGRPWPVDKVAHHIVTGIYRRHSEVHFGIKLRLLNLFGSFIKPLLYNSLRYRKR